MSMPPATAVRERNHEMEDSSPGWRRRRRSGGSEEVRRIRRELVEPQAQDLQQPHRLGDGPGRPATANGRRRCDYVDLIFDEFVELHGDRAIGDDRAIRTGFARLGDFRVMLIGHQKGHTLQGADRVLLRLRPSRRAIARH